MKLWQKGSDVHKLIEQFTVGNDYVLDQIILPYDIQASIAHAKMLHKSKLLSKKELDTLVKGLKEISILHSKGKFPITVSDEDGHTAIENYLTKKYGTVGKKIHTGRSRNDQVITAMRLYEKAEVKIVLDLLSKYKQVLKSAIQKSGKVPLPGYTHMQKAMPSSVGMWLGSYLSSIEDTEKLIKHVLKTIDQNPLGSAAGFGVPVLKTNRAYTAKQLGFATVMKNPMYVQHSRGKFEALIVHALVQIMYDMNKLAFDLMLFSMQEFGFVKLPEQFCTGSSIMPQKKNPDVLELTRAKYSVIMAEEFKLLSLTSSLMSGYNRDTQLTKEPVIRSIEITKETLQVMTLVLHGLLINKKRCKEAMTDELFATEEAYKLVAKGIPFREAYQRVGKKYSS